MNQFKFEKGVRYIKIYGLQRSGTNFAADLLNRNFKNTKALVNIGGWKHGTYAAPYILGKEVDVLVIVKEPFAWLRSMYDYWGPNRKLNIGPDLRNVAFEQFLKSPVVFEMQQGIPYLFRAANPIQYWNNMNFHYLSIRMEEKKMIVLSYEALIAEFDVSMLKLADYFDLDPVSSDLEFTKEPNEFKPSEETPTTTDEEFVDRLNYYKNKEYMKYYSQDLLQFVGLNLDREVLTKVGYHLGR